MSDAIRALLGRLIDDAGQFPPARLPLEEAVAAHERARAGAWSWMVGRFLCPASRLGEAETLPVPLGVVSDGTWDADLDDAVSMGADAFELRDPGAGAYPMLGAAPLDVFVEGAPSLEALAGSGVGAKLRCGGLSPDAFPADETVAQFICGCRDLGLPFKLTAGLHHPFRAPHAELGVLQHGFVNLLAAGILEVERPVEIVAEKDPAAFTISPDGLGWRGAWARVEDIERGRRLFTAFGSCSLDEPVEDLVANGVLDAARVRAN